MTLNLVLFLADIALYDGGGDEGTPCLKTNCGEGGCYHDENNNPVCVCLKTMKPPNEEGMCLFNETDIQQSIFNFSSSNFRKYIF